MANIENRLKELGIDLPKAAAPAANYVPTVITGSQLWVAGQVPVADGKLQYVGKVGGEVSEADGVAAARLCGLNILAQAKAALGDLDRVARVIKLVGFVNGAPGFNKFPVIVNGASDLMVELFGDAGKHARSAVGAGNLPFDVAVEVEAVFEIK